MSGGHGAAVVPRMTRRGAMTISLRIDELKAE
jgi:hypothetical protein